MKNHLTLGKAGEQLAVDFLNEKGYTILQQNYVADRYEIDIVAIKNEVLTFVEVKTRSTDFFGEPEESVTSKKEKHIAAAAELYIEQFEDNFTDVQYDIIAIVLNDNTSKIKHIEDAFFPKGF